MTTRNRHSVKLFYSYAHEDERWRKELAKHLGRVNISGWYDREIKAGTSWENEIDENLEEADIVLLLVSPDFKASDYCYGKEMKVALKRQKEEKAHVIPIFIRPVHWPDAPYLHLQIPNSGQPVTISTN